MHARPVQMLRTLALLTLADGVSGAVAHASPYPKGVYDAASARKYFATRPLEVAGRCAPFFFTRGPLPSAQACPALREGLPRLHSPVQPGDAPGPAGHASSSSPRETHA